jgi:ArsR family transcriptional regulator
LLAAPLSEKESTELARLFAALADPVRLRLLSMVAAADEVCSCDLEDPLGKSQPTISHHTRALADAGLITGEKRGRWMMWRIVPERLGALRAALA